MEEKKLTYIDYYLDLYLKSNEDMILKANFTFCVFVNT